MVKFQLGLFDDPFVDPDLPPRSSDARLLRAGRRAQAESMALLKNAEVDGVPTLPLITPLAVYVEGFPAEEAARLGDVVADPGTPTWPSSGCPPPSTRATTSSWRPSSIRARSTTGPGWWLVCATSPGAPRS